MYLRHFDPGLTETSLLLLQPEREGVVPGAPPAKEAGIHASCQRLILGPQTLYYNVEECVYVFYKAGKACWTANVDQLS